MRLKPATLRFVRIGILCTGLLWLVTGVDSATTPSEGGRLAMDIEAYEKEISILEPRVCLLAPAGRAAEEGRYQDQRSLLRRDSDALRDLLDRETSALDSIKLPASQKDLLREYIRAEEETLRDSCPLLNPARERPEKTADSSHSLSASQAVTIDPHANEKRNSCESTDLYEIFPQ